MTVINGILRILYLGVLIWIVMPSVAFSYSEVPGARNQIEYPLFMCDVVAIGHFTHVSKILEQKDRANRTVEFTVSEHLSGNRASNPLSILFHGTASIAGEDTLDRNDEQNSGVSARPAHPDTPLYNSERPRNPQVPKELYDLLDTVKAEAKNRRVSNGEVAVIDFESRYVVFLLQRDESRFVFCGPPWDFMKGESADTVAKKLRAKQQELKSLSPEKYEKIRQIYAEKRRVLDEIRDRIENDRKEIENKQKQRTLQ